MHWQHAWQLSEQWYESDDRVTRQATSDRGDRQPAARMYAGFTASGTRLA